MTETKRTRELCKAYRQRRPQADVYRCNDRVTPGRPDIVITDYGATLWIEAKRWDGEITAKQHEVLTRLAQVSRGLAYVVWYQRDGGARLCQYPAGVEQRLHSLAGVAAALETILATRALGLTPAAPVA